MPKFKAPKHTTQVFGPHRIFNADEQGVIAAGDKLSDPDRDALRRAGCVEIAAEAPPADDAGSQDAAALGAKAKA